MPATAPGSFLQEVPAPVAGAAADVECRGACDELRGEAVDLQMVLEVLVREGRANALGVIVHARHPVEDPFHFPECSGRDSRRCDYLSLYIQVT